MAFQYQREHGVLLSYAPDSDFPWRTDMAYQLISQIRAQSSLT
jgi:hypothetical protein